MPSFPAELVARAALSPRVELMTFRASEPFPRVGGQYVLLTLPQGTTHAFSVASPFDEHDPGRFDIAVARGTSAGAVLDLALGQHVQITGPSGSLIWKGDAPALLVATGTGISPLRALLLEQLKRAATGPLRLLFGCRDTSEELWGEEFSRLARMHPRFKYYPIYSQPTGAPSSTGRVQVRVAELAHSLGHELRAYLCGHTPMVKDCTDLLVKSGVPAAHIHAESY
jgi:CDP-4-dehydro-6-deoxyglucose reductase, E3